MNISDRGSINLIYQMHKSLYTKKTLRRQIEQHFKDQHVNAQRAKWLARRNSTTGTWTWSLDFESIKRSTNIGYKKGTMVLLRTDFIHSTNSLLQAVGRRCKYGLNSPLTLIYSLLTTMQLNCSSYGLVESIFPYLKSHWSSDLLWLIKWSSNDDMPIWSQTIKDFMWFSFPNFELLPPN